MTKPNVGFIGLGSQGGPMARRIVEAGFPLTIWARRAEALEAYADTAAKVVGSPAELGAACDIVGICVVDGADVEDVLMRADGVLAGMAAGGIVAVHSTIHPSTCRRLAGQAAGRGISVIDAPVSGGGMAAAERRLLVMVGGDDDSVERCRPVFESFGNPIIHLGGVGAGQLAKVLNNLVFTAQVAVALDTYALAARLGLDQKAVGEVLAHGSGGSYAAGILGRSGVDVAGLQQAASLLRKDVDIALDLARASDATPPLLSELAATALQQLAHGALRARPGGPAG